MSHLPDDSCPDGRASDRTNGLPEKAIKLARRVAGLPVGRAATRYTFDIIMLPDGTWWLTVEKQQQMERLGSE